MMCVFCKMKVYENFTKKKNKTKPIKTNKIEKIEWKKMKKNLNSMESTIG
jgi:hypothetical protein